MGTAEAANRQHFYVLETVEGQTRVWQKTVHNVAWGVGLFHDIADLRADLVAVREVRLDLGRVADATREVLQAFVDCCDDAHSVPRHIIPALERLGIPFPDLEGVE